MAGWITRELTKTEQRRAELDAAVVKVHGLAASAWVAAATCRPQGGWLEGIAQTVADSMRWQNLVARIVRKRRELTRQDRTAPKFPDLLKRNFHAGEANIKWCGDMTEIPTREGKFYLATVIDL